MIPEKEPRCESPVRLREQEPEVRQLHQAPPWLGIQEVLIFLCALSSGLNPVLQQTLQSGAYLI